MVQQVLQSVGRFLKIAHLLRVQIFFAVFLLALMPWGVFYIKLGTFLGLADAIGWKSLAGITLALYMLAYTLHITTQLVLIYGPERFWSSEGKPEKGAPDFTGFSRWTLPIALLLPVPTLVAVWMNTAEPGCWSKFGAILAGFIVAAMLFYIAAILHRYAEGADQPTVGKMYPSWVGKWPWMPNPAKGGRLHLGFPGTLEDSPGLTQYGQLRSGHRMAILFSIAFLLVYAGFGLWGIHVEFNTEDLPAAICYVFLLVGLLTWILSGVTFTLDRYHIPTMTVLLGASILWSYFVPTDHEFNVRLLPKGTRAKTISTREVVKGWESEHIKSTTAPLIKTAPLIVVATEGGGIEAAAWTNIVLGNLEKEIGPKMHDSIVLISSVSGGSTGAYYYLNQYVSGSKNFTYDETCNTKPATSAYCASVSTSLSAAAWGLIYPDFLRAVPGLALAIQPDSDRGATMERAWQQNGGTEEWLSSWIPQAKAGKMPAVIFNATGVETGQPVLFSTTRLEPILPLFNDKNDNGLEQQFLSDFPDADLRVSTAARMSATFPWVSPEARPSQLLDNIYCPESMSWCCNMKCKEKYDTKRLHVADGGLFDNSGIVSAVHWIRDLNAPDSADNTKNQHPIILLMITSPYGVAAGKKWSWMHQSIGPVETLMDVRTGSQHLRRNLETQLLSDNLGAQDLHVLRFCDSTDPKFKTMSWHLTKSQRKAVEETWEKNYATKDANSPNKEIDALRAWLKGDKNFPQPDTSCSQKEQK